MDSPGSYPAEFGDIISGFQPAFGGVSSVNQSMPHTAMNYLQGAGGQAEGQAGDETSRTKDNRNAIDFIAYAKNALGELGPEFQSVPDEVLGKWLKEILGGNDTGIRVPSRGREPLIGPMPHDPANRAIQGGINKAGF